MSSKFHERMATSATNQMGSIVSWTERRFRQTVKAGLCGVASVAFFNLLVAWTILGYLVLYWIVIPRPISFESRLHFDFDPAKDGPFDLDGRSKVPFEFPVAEVYFPSFDQQFLIEVPLRPHNLTTKDTKRLFPGRHENPIIFGEIYDVHLNLELPDLPLNSDIGNFMVDVELFNQDGPMDNRTTTSLVRSRRPVIVPFQTWVSKLASDVLYLPFRMLGFFQPMNHIEIDVIEGWIEESDHRRLPNAARVMLSDPRLRVKDSKIRFQIRLSGLRYMMHYWFWTMFALLVAVAVTLQSWAAISAYFLRYLVPSVSKRVHFNFDEIFGAQEEEPEEIGQSSSTDEDDSIGSDGFVETKDPVEEEELPSASEPAIPPAPDSFAFDQSDDDRDKSISELFPSMARTSEGEEQSKAATTSSTAVLGGEVQPIVLEVQSASPAVESTPTAKVVIEAPLPTPPGRNVSPTQQSDSFDQSSPGERRTHRLSSDLDVVLVDASSIPEVDSHGQGLSQGE